MLDAIYRLNRWYDRLDNEHGVLRFGLFIIPMMIFTLLIYWPRWGIPNIIGLLGFALFALVRVIPFAFPRR